MKRSIILFVTCIYSLGCFEPKPNIIETGLEGEQMPPIDLLLMDSLTLVNTKTSSSRKPSLVFYFNPQCQYCRLQTKEIIENAESLNDYSVYMISTFPFGMIKDYYQYYNLKKYPNIMVGQDLNDSFAKYYDVPGVPYITVYDHHKNLRKAFLGNVTYKTLKHAFSN